MMQERDLQELAELTSTDAPILSLYLSADPHRRSNEEHKLSLRKLLSQATEQGAAPADTERIERFFEHEYNRQGRGIACFSLQKKGFWREYELLVPVEDFVFLGQRPYIAPLTDIWDNYGRFGVVMVDREARGSSSTTSARWRIRPARWATRSSDTSRAAGPRKSCSATRIKRQRTTSKTPRPGPMNSCANTPSHAWSSRGVTATSRCSGMSPRARCRTRSWARSTWT